MLVSVTAAPGVVVPTDAPPKASGLGLAEPVGVPAASVKVAVTVAAAESVTTHVPVPLQPPPLQPVKSESPPGLAVNVTKFDAANDAEQVEPHSMPDGLDVTSPDPVPNLD